MSMRAFVTVLLCATLAFTGCRKKSALEFYKLESTYSVMTARDGEEAYEDPAMDEVVAGLKAIGEDTVEGPKAVALLAKIAAERARLAQEKAAAEAELAAAQAAAKRTLPSLIETQKDPTTPPAIAPTPSAVDAGPTRPYQGMTRAEFDKAFSACTESAGEIDVPGQGPMQGAAVQDRYSCRQQFSVPEGTRYVFLFKDGKLKVERTEQLPAPVAPPKPAQPVDAGPPAVFYLPGMPVPQ
jgi:hypothetical protein